MNEGELFWRRLSLVTDLFDFINDERKTKHALLLKGSESESALVSRQPVFENEYSRMIWNIIKDERELQDVAIIALMDAEKYEFNKVSSVRDKEGDRDNNKDDSKRLMAYGSFEKLKNTRLLKHTYHVVFYASTLKKSAGGHYQSLLLLSLLHDFGKHKEIANIHHSQAWTFHEEVSANYARTIMRSAGNFTDNYIESIVHILKTHHLSSLKAPLYDLLNTSDRMARQLETIL